MPAKFERDGISLQYPENWQLIPDGYPSGWGVTVQSPATAYLTLTLDGSRPGIGELADTALAALRDIYPELEEQSVSSTLAGLPCIGYDAEFFSLDLTNTCMIRAIALASGTLMVLAQVTDLEGHNLAVLRAIMASLRIDEDE